MTLSAGTRLGPYEIQSALGAGGMGEVYKACDTRLESTVAIKILAEQFAVVIMAADVHVTASSFEADTPTPVFRTRSLIFIGPQAGGAVLPYAVSADGRRFLVLSPVADAADPITLVLNWTAALRKS